jgi:hypothetical protein
LFGAGRVFVWSILTLVSVRESGYGRARLASVKNLDKRSSYAAIGLDPLSSSLFRISYALSQREPSVAKSSVMSAAWSPVALWGISPAPLAEVVVLVDEEACSERVTAFARAR